MFFLKLCFIFSFLLCSHTTVFEEIAASHRGLRLYHFPQEGKSLWVHEAGNSLAALLYSSSL